MKNLIIPLNRSFEIEAKNAVINNPIYHYPFLQLAETTLAVNLSGLAIRFLDLCEEMTMQKINGKTKRLTKSLGQAEAKLVESRKHFYRVASSSWKRSERKKTLPKPQLQEVSKASQ